MNNPDMAEYVRYRMGRAVETLNELSIHIDNKLWNTAINRMYYACFYAVGALLIKNGIKAASHTGVRHQFGQNFVKTGIVSRQLAKHYTDLFEKRNKGDYNDFYDYTEEIVMRLYPLTKSFIEEIRNLVQDNVNR